MELLVVSTAAGADSPSGVRQRGHLRIRWHLMLAVLACALSSLPAYSATITYQVLIDSDAVATGQCSFAVSDAGGTTTVEGIDYQFTVKVDDATDEVLSRGIAACAPNASVAKAVIPLQAAVGVTSDGDRFIEAGLLWSVMPGSETVRVVHTTLDETTGGTDVNDEVFSRAGGQVYTRVGTPAAIPLLGAAGLVVTALLVVGLGIGPAGRRRLPVLLVLVVSSGLVWAAAIVVDGDAADWDGVVAVADVAGDTTSGTAADIHAGYLTDDGTMLYFRVDLDPLAAPVVNTHQTALNDTGITRCADATQSGLACPQASLPNQDADIGRDVTTPDGGDGAAGFSYTKLDSDGNPLSASATAWACVRDEVSGLIWEVKTDQGGLHDQTGRYTWFNPDMATNGGFAGVRDGGNCTGSQCDISAFVQAVNAERLCGYRDWRVPSMEELRSLFDQSRTAALLADSTGPTIEDDWFPYTSTGPYWTMRPMATDPQRAWYGSFFSASDAYADKSYSAAVRVVRGGTPQ